MKRREALAAALAAPLALLGLRVKRTWKTPLQAPQGPSGYKLVQAHGFYNRQLGSTWPVNRTATWTLHD